MKINILKFLRNKWILLLLLIFIIYFVYNFYLKKIEGMVESESEVPGTGYDDKIPKSNIFMMKEGEEGEPKQTICEKDPTKCKGKE